MGQRRGGVQKKVCGPERSGPQNSLHSERMQPNSETLYLDLPALA
jgi:hypothetical protein